jgi:flagellar protein FliO/FliZ
MQALTFIFAFIAVLALLGAGAWLLRRFAGNRLSTTTNRGRGPRLAVIDAAAVDTRRRLVLVRRDNVEHLLMIGGPTDIVVEPNIVRATVARDPMAQRPAVGSEPPPRIAPLPDGGWNDGEGARSDAFDHADPQMPEPPQQLPRPPFADEVRRSAQPHLERRGDPLAGFSPEPIAPRSEPRDTPLVAPRTTRTEPMIPRPIRQESAKPPPIRAERPAASPPSPPPMPPPVPAPTLSNADQNLAEMAQRLEAALRRTASRAEPSIAPPGETPGPKTGFENLEDEMASLLGRPKSPS